MNENSENLPNGSSMVPGAGGGGGGVGGNAGISTDSNTNGSYNSKNTIVIENQPKRRVSIASDPAADSRMGGVGIGAYDNPAFEQNPRRKISQVSYDEEEMKKKKTKITFK